MTKPLAIDASFAFRLILPGPQQVASQHLVTEWRHAGHVLWAPTLWVYEINSALCKAVHFGALTPEQGQRTLVLTQKLDVRSVPPDDAQVRKAFDWTLRLKRAAAYDSFYLALAETMDCANSGQRTCACATLWTNPGCGGLVVTETSRRCDAPRALAILQACSP
jgi:predicted nucleic acid-binding protein